ncbi:MAG: HEAT repeat domain-containing protein, partial [Armatimonadetes bacterium]|nr:HEAT repeat domain-containing protein [Armatimonadota bacterium]
ARATGDGAALQELAEATGHVGGSAGAAALRAWLAEHPDGELRPVLAAMRALGWLRDAAAVPLLARTLNEHLAPPSEAPGDREMGAWQRPVYLAATAAEALGRIGGPEAERALLAALPELADFQAYTLACGDHPWLVGCHSSPLHYRLLEALDALGSRGAGPSVPVLVRSLPMDKDRALLFEPDSYEALTARVIQRSGRAGEVVETCLAWLGDAAAARAPDLWEAVSASPHAEAHIRPHSPAARAAQELSVVCLDPAYAPRVRAAAERAWRASESEERSWVCFLLFRALGRLGDAASVDLLRTALAGPDEASFGFHPPPNHWAYQAMPPFFRAAAARALGELGDPTAVPLLRRVVEGFGNATAVRCAAAEALGKLARPADLPALSRLADDYPEWSTRRVLEEARDRLRAAAR